MEEKSLSIAFADSLADDVISCIGEYAEIGLDAILNDGVLKDIPIISTAVALYKIGNSIIERHNLKKLSAFLDEINNGIANEEKRKIYQQRIKLDEEFSNQQIEYLLVLIARYISYDKPRLLAKLYLAYLDGIIIWEELTMYAEVIDRFLLLDCRTLLSADGKVSVHRNIGGESVLRLVALGLMTETNENSIFETGNDRFSITPESMARFSSNDKAYRRTEFGEKLAEILK